MNGLQIFNYQDTQVRTIVKDGEPWFVAKDVCGVLDIANSRDAVGRLDGDEKGVVSTDTLGGQQELQVVNEPGLYTLVLGSRKPEAKSFKRWITHEVIPALRKTGSYEIKPLTELEVARRYVAALEDRDRLQAQIAEQTPKVEAFNTFLGAKNSQTMNQVAKALDIGRNRLFSILREKQILMYGNNLPFQRYINAGYFTVREVSIKDGEEIITQTLVTAKGVDFLRRALKSNTELISA